MQQLPTVKRSKEASAGKRLPYARHLDARTLETRDGLLMQVIHLAGLPFETADSEELNYRKAVRDVMLRGLSISNAFACQLLLAIIGGSLNSSIRSLDAPPMSKSKRQ